MSRLSGFFGFPDASGDIHRLSVLLALLLPIVALTITLSSTFFIIFIAEWLGNGSYIEGLALVGVMTVLQMAVQTIFDYPTAALGDALGHKWIIMSSFLTFSLGFYMVSLIGPGTSIVFVAVLFLLMGFGNSQLSGTFMAWFDNNYRVAMPGDSDRKQYGVFLGKVGMLFQIVATLSLIPGSILAVIFGRPWVFQMQAILCIIIALACFKLIEDLPEVKAARTKRPSFSEYTGVLSDGIRFLFSDKYVTYLILGGCIVMSTGMVWGSLILFPMYFAYLLTDVAVSSFRTLLFGIGVVNQERSGVWSKRFEPKKWIPRFRFLQMTGAMFYMVFAVVMLLFPPTYTAVDMLSLTVPFTQLIIMQIPSSSIVPLLLMLVTFTISGFFGGFAEILTQRELLDVIPNNIRNSMYSLSPTIATLLAMPQIAFFGWLIPAGGFPITLALAATISFVGVVLIAKGLSHPKPMASDLVQVPQAEPKSISTIPEE